MPPERYHERKKQELYDALMRYYEEWYDAKYYNRPVRKPYMDHETKLLIENTNENLN
jgi:AcrR family transcriptional regulator